MKLDILRRQVAGIPFTTPRKGAVLYNVVLERKYSRCLELGFAHGVGTAYIAAALEELQAGKVIALDRRIAAKRQPRADALIESLGLSPWTEIIYAASSYNWYLMERLQHRDMEFDFCFLDGSHHYEVDGLAILLVERLLRPGGLLILDDLDWSFATSPTLGDTPKVKLMPEHERTTPHVRKVFELLIRNNPAYSEVYEKDGWGFAFKS